MAPSAVPPPGSKGVGHHHASSATGEEETKARVAGPSPLGAATGTSLADRTVTAVSGGGQYKKTLAVSAEEPHKLVFKESLMRNEDLGKLFGEFPNPDQITEMDLDCTYLTDFSFLQRFKNLQKLTIANSYKFENFETLKCASLRVLELISCGIKTLKGLKDSALQGLYLRDCIGLRNISDLPVTLQKLSLEGCQSVPSLAPVASLVNLTELDISRLSKKKVDDIDEPITLSHLMKLILKGSDIPSSKFQGTPNCELVE